MKIKLKSIQSGIKSLKVIYIYTSHVPQAPIIKFIKNYFSHVDLASNLTEGLDKYIFYYDNNINYDLIVLDVDISKQDCIDMVQKIYSKNKKQKIIITSEYASQKVLIDLINVGIEGFLEKPISFNQLAVIFGRICTNEIEDNKVLLPCNCIYDLTLKTISHCNKNIILTHNEQKIIELLVENYPLAFSTESIFNYIYFDKAYKHFSDDSVRSLIKRLRIKLPKELIETNRFCNGYQIKAL